jgi:hypothetical protein
VIPRGPTSPDRHLRANSAIENRSAHDGVTRPISETEHVFKHGICKAKGLAGRVDSKIQQRSMDSNLVLPWWNWKREKICFLT